MVNPIFPITIILIYPLPLSSVSMKGLVQIIIGLLFWVGMTYLLLIPSWLSAAYRLLQGGIVWGLLFVGLGLVLLGLSELRG